MYEKLPWCIELVECSTGIEWLNGIVDWPIWKERKLFSFDSTSQMFLSLIAATV